MCSQQASIQTVVMNILYNFYIDQIFIRPIYKILVTQNYLTSNVSNVPKFCSATKHVQHSIYGNNYLII